MREKYERISLSVEAQKYEIGEGLEDGFEPWSNVVTDGWIVTDKLVKIEKDGRILCPYIKNRRGIVFIRENDYIIYEENGERHCCGGDKFKLRFKKPQE
ncbi:MAG: hypothetical protein HFI37_04130 [Lachnospiraceae bacterium]|jgi:hypothetical protein|nr:hypothetical protein [Lachnospiraceae bacterium]